MIPTVAIQTDPQPTNKVSAASNTAGGIAGVLAGVMTVYGGDAIRETLSVLPIGPKLQDLIVFAVVAVAGFYASKLGGQAAAYNVLDKPNVALQPVTTPTP